MSNASFNNTSKQFKKVPLASVNKVAAFDYGVFLLSLRLQSTESVRQKLLKKKYPAAEVADTIVRLLELKYLNDSQFAEVYFENLKKYKSFGFFGIKKKLMDAKLPAVLIERLLKDFSLKDELSIAKKFVAKNSAKTAVQLSRMLASRGFRADTVYKVVKYPQE